MNAPVKLSIYRRRGYRNFATAHPSQELTDDLVDSAAEQACLKSLFYPSVRPLEPALERVLGKSAQHAIQAEIDAKFCPGTWYSSRFSDGTWPVLYAAESEKTALKEVLFHLREFYKEELRTHALTLDRRVATLSLASTACADLSATPNLDTAALTSIDNSGYPYCQRLAVQCRRSGAALLRARSARDPEGFCLAIFDKTIIKKDNGHLRYIKLVLGNDTSQVFAEKRID